MKSQDTYDINVLARAIHVLLNKTGLSGTNIASSVRDVVSGTETQIQTVEKVPDLHLTPAALDRLTGILWRLAEELPEATSKRKWKVAIEDFERVLRGQVPKEKITPPMSVKQRRALRRRSGHRHPLFGDIPLKPAPAGPYKYERRAELPNVQWKSLNDLRLGSIVESNTGLYESVMVWDNRIGDSRLEFQPRDWKKCAGDLNMKHHKRILLHRRALYPDEATRGRTIVEAVWNEDLRTWRMFNPWGVVTDVDWTFWHWWMPAPKGPV